MFMMVVMMVMMLMVIMTQKGPRCKYLVRQVENTRERRPCYMRTAAVLVTYLPIHPSTHYMRCPWLPARQFVRADGPPLPMDEQLCGLPELPVLRAVSPVHVRRLRLRCARLRTPLSCHGQQHRGKSIHYRTGIYYSSTTLSHCIFFNTVYVFTTQ